jgi:hypothetical protein
MYHRIIQNTVEHLNKLEIVCSRFLATAAALPCSVATLCRCTVVTLCRCTVATLQMHCSDTLQMHCSDTADAL